MKRLFDPHKYIYINIYQQIIHEIMRHLIQLCRNMKYSTQLTNAAMNELGINWHIFIGDNCHRIVDHQHILITVYLIGYHLLLLHPDLITFNVSSSRPILSISLPLFHSSFLSLFLHSLPLIQKLSTHLVINWTSHQHNFFIH